MSALVVHSGGLDSTVALKWAINQYGSAEAISFSYGQRHSAEIRAAKDICGYLSTPHFEQDVTLGVGGVLMTDEEMPHYTYAELAEMEGPSPTYVPYRNGTFLSLAASHAISRNCEVVVAGMHSEDAHNWAYPDCTPEFIGAMQAAIYVGSYHKVRLVCPFTYLQKWEIVTLGIELGAPLELTMSCYEGTRPACGKCPTCVARMKAFDIAEATDPIEYEGVTA